METSQRHVKAWEQAWKVVNDMDGWRDGWMEACSSSVETSKIHLSPTLGE